MTLNPQSFPWFRVVYAVCGTLVALLGGVALAAWASNSPVLIRLHDQFDPLHYNAALALVIWGCGLAAVSADFRRTTRAAGGLLIAAAILGAVCLAIGRGFGLESWAFPNDRILPPFPPGTLGSETAAGFLLGGIGLILMARRSRELMGTVALTLVGTGLLVGTGAAVIDSPLGRGSGQHPGPPLFVCIGSVLGGLIALLSAAQAVRSHFPVAPLPQS